MNRFGWHWNTAPFGIQPLFDCLNIELVWYSDPHCILFLLSPATKRNMLKFWAISGSPTNRLQQTGSKFEPRNDVLRDHYVWSSHIS